MTKHELIDNFLSEEEFRPIYNIFMGMQIAWNCYDGIVMPGDGKIQFVHPLYCDFAPSSLYWRDLQPIFDKLDPVSFVRSKANLNMKTPEIEEYELHTDVDDAITSIYYVNTNNGYTRFEDGTKVDSIANRMLIFDSNLKHAGTSCTDELRRCVINFNYYV